jgi:hypothetical protein
MNILSILVNNLTELAKNANTKGIPLPLLRDPKSGLGSYTLTMFFLAFNVAIVTLIGKVTNYLGNVEYSNVLWLLGLTGSFYLGRGLRGDGKRLELDGIGKTDGV